MLYPTRGRSSPAAGARAGLSAPGRLLGPRVSLSKVAPHKCEPTASLRSVFTHRLFSNGGGNERPFHRGRWTERPTRSRETVREFQLKSAAIEIWNTTR